MKEIERIRKLEKQKDNNPASKSHIELTKDEKERLKKQRKEFHMNMFNQWRKLIHIKWKMKAYLKKIREKKAEAQWIALMNASPSIVDMMPRQNSFGLDRSWITELDEEHKSDQTSF